MNKNIANQLTGGLTLTTKMNCYSFSIPAQKCKLGSKLRKKQNTVCSGCYALKGNYARFKNVMRSQYNRLNLYYKNRRQWVNAIVTLVRYQQYFRWFDSGDIQNLTMLENIVKVCKLTPETMHWLPTREFTILKAYKEKHGSFPSNLTVRLSAVYINANPPESAAKMLNINTSNVSNNIESVTCPSWKQNNNCGSCRLCWNKETKNITYKLH
jgi:hypothetical protein